MLIAWENDAFLAFEEFGKDKFEIVAPSLSILAEPPVAVVDGNVDAKGTRKQARGLSAISLHAGRRRRSSPRTTSAPPIPSAAAKEDLARFPKLDLITVDDAFGGWKKAQATHFADGGMFDQIQKALH